MNDELNDSIDVILGHHIDKSNNTKYLVKLVNRSYRSAQWINENAFREYKNGETLLMNYKANPQVQKAKKPYFDQHFLVVDKIIQFKDEKFLVKWSHLNYENLTIESQLPDKIAFNTFNSRSSVKFPRLTEINEIIKPKNLMNSYSLFEKKLKKSEVEHINSFISSLDVEEIVVKDDFRNESMKVCIGFISYLFDESFDNAPFIFVFDDNDELLKWYDYCSNSNVLTSLEYNGTNKNREIIREMDFFGEGDTLKFHVLFTTKEIFQNDNYIKQIYWKCGFLISKNNENISDDYKILHKFIINLITPDMTINSLKLISESFCSKDIKENLDNNIVNNLKVIEKINKKLNIEKKQGENMQQPLIYTVIECPMVHFQKFICCKLIFEMFNNDILKNNFFGLYNYLYYAIQHPFIIPTIEKQYSEQGIIKSSIKMEIVNYLLLTSLENNAKMLILTKIPFIYNLLNDFIVMNNYKNNTTTYLYSENKSIPNKYIDCIIIYDGGVDFWNPIIESSGKKIYKIFVLENCDFLEKQFTIINDEYENICKNVTLSSLIPYSSIDVPELVSYGIPSTMFYADQHSSDFPNIELKNSNFWSNLLSIPKEQIVNLNYQYIEKEPLSLNKHWEFRELNQFIRTYLSLGYENLDKFNDYSGLNLDEKTLKIMFSSLLQKAKSDTTSIFSILPSLLIANTRNIDISIINSIGMDDFYNPMKLLKRINILYFVKYITKNNIFQNLNFYLLSLSKPIEWWENKHDIALLKAIEKHGIDNYYLLNNDDENLIEIIKSRIPITTIRFRAKQLCQLVYNYILDDIHKKDNILNCSYQGWNFQEQQKVLKYLMKYGIPENQDGNSNYELIVSRFQSLKKNPNDMKNFIDYLKDKAHNPNPNAGLSIVVSVRLRQRILTIHQLNYFLRNVKLTQAEIFFKKVQKWNVPTNNFTPELEYLFFSDLLKFGISNAKNILLSPKYAQISSQKMISFVSKICNIISRINEIYLASQDIKSMKCNFADPLLNTLKFPLKVCSKSYVYCFGKVITDRPGFHSQRYIYPVGYKSSIQMPSLKNQNKKATWYSEILDCGGQYPVFRVWQEGYENDCSDGNTPTSAWAQALKKKESCLSGPDLFLLSSPIVRYCIQKLPEMNSFSEYKYENFDENTTIKKFLKQQNISK